MPSRRSIGAFALAGALSIVSCVAQASDATKYPDWKGEWMRLGTRSFDLSRPAGLEQKVPPTAEFQTVLEASLADQAAGGQGNNPMGECMPRIMIDYEGMEFVITPETAYIMLLEPMNQLRPIYTDGRGWPEQIKPSFLGYSIGTWVDADGDGRFDALLVETRRIKGPTATTAAVCLFTGMARP